MGLRRFQRSDSVPLMTFKILATASAAPSITPSDTGVAPSTVVRKNGKSGYTDSVAVSFRRLTPPRIHTPFGSEYQRRDLSGTRNERTIDRYKRKWPLCQTCSPTAR